LNGSTASFWIADVSQALDRSCYRFNLQANGVFGSAQNLGAFGTATAIVVGDVTYTVTYDDIGGDETVNAGDWFAVRNLRASTEYAFYLLWSDGSQVQVRSWGTP